MSTPKRRRPSPAVYRRRRLAVLLLALVVIGGIVWLVVAQPWSALFAGDDDAEPTSTPAPTPTATMTTSEPTPSATPQPTATETAVPAAEACDPAVLEVTAVTDKTEYAAGELPQFSISLANTGDVDCVLNVGTTTQRFVVTSGADTWWQSTDCQSEPSDMEVTLAAGQTVQSAEPVIWDRTRSSTETCDSEERPAAAGGGATYNLAVSIGGVDAAEPATFLLY
ncbi:hypothetical protein [Microbacterium gilvum]|uniref:DUF4232 domain-containing protein n=1 Tax=Microbacterium gilvum TaxID=1336204 RepID=A0ABP9A9H8_9MICO